MFSIIVSEKGGAERREHYERTEINVGRVQGNDLMLPKGNVSKRHARLLYRDGRFIVTDLKSTNGTYVNGRKIAQATIVREGDKIYIGDFVLRIEATPATSAPSAIGSGSSEEVTGDPANGNEPSHSSQPSQPSSAEKLARAAAPRIEAPRIEAKVETRDVISHFPLEQDPDESAPAYAVPGPPRIPSGPRMTPSTRSSGPPAAPLPTMPPTGLRTAAPTASSALASPVPSPSAMPISPAPAGRRAIPPTSDRSERPNAEVLQRRVAIAAVVERVAGSMDLSSLASGAPAEPSIASAVERAIADRIAAMRSENEMPAELDADAIAADARRELLELGPIGAMLDDEEVSEIQLVRHDYLLFVQGRRQVAADLAFANEDSVARIIRRLCVAAGRPLDAGEVYVERRLPQGARLFAVLPPASDQGHVVVLRKPQRADLSLDDLVRSGTISRAMAGLFAQCIAARANVLVTGSIGAGTTSLIAALAAVGSTEDRVIVLQEDDELIFNQPHTVSILLGESPEEGVRAVRAAARIHPDRLVVGAFAGPVAAEVVDAIGDGIDGVLAAARAPTLRQAVLRITADLAATRAGLTPEAAREWLGSAFDLAIEIARLRDGRHRVMRVAELSVEAGAVVIRDVFTFAVERTAAGGAVEGSFHATGIIPRIVEDLAARGASVDTSVFKRQSGR